MFAPVKGKLPSQVSSHCCPRKCHASFRKPLWRQGNSLRLNWYGLGVLREKWRLMFDHPRLEWVLSISSGLRGLQEHVFPKHTANSTSTMSFMPIKSTLSYFTSQIWHWIQHLQKWIYLYQKAYQNIYRSHKATFWIAFSLASTIYSRDQLSWTQDG